VPVLADGMVGRLVGRQLRHVTSTSIYSVDSSHSNQVVLPGKLLHTLLTPRTLVRSVQYLTLPNISLFSTMWTPNFGTTNKVSTASQLISYPMPNITPNPFEHYDIALEEYSKKRNGFKRWITSRSRLFWVVIVLSCLCTGFNFVIVLS
jgi:hypothetical protein